MMQTSRAAQCSVSRIVHDEPFEQRPSGDSDSHELRCKHNPRTGKARRSN